MDAMTGGSDMYPGARLSSEHYLRAQPVFSTSCLISWCRLGHWGYGCGYGYGYGLVYLEYLCRAHLEFLLALSSHAGALPLTRT